MSWRARPISMAPVAMGCSKMERPSEGVLGEALEGEGELHEIAGDARAGGANVGEAGGALADQRSRDGGDGNR